ncbi:MAG TPA: PH domain-containing protein [Candidatus Hydrogenedentes bacterium]|nr:PH domain-containing protein [Candidatus Hydrogenedentota bacterium]
MPESVIESGLGDNETLLWAGRPRQGFVFRRGDVFVIPFTVSLIAFPVLVAMAALQEVLENPGHEGILFPILILPFALPGLFLLFAHFLVDSKRRAKTFYGVTNRRMIIVSGIFSRHVKSLNIRTLTDVSLNEKPNGDGTITFGAVDPMSHWFGGAYWPSTPYGVPSFEMVPNVKTVYAQICETQERAWRGD